MKQARKNQLNKKLEQTYEYGSGRIEGIIEDLLQEQFLGHMYFIHKIKETKEYKSTEFSDEEKTYTLIEFGLYQTGEGCIETFDMPVSETHLKKIESHIDMAYYRWMQRYPQWIKKVRPHDYYEMLAECTIDPSNHDLTKEDFEKMSEEDRDTWIESEEWNAFLPSRESKTGEE